MDALAQGTELGYTVHEAPRALTSQLPNLPKELPLELCVALPDCLNSFLNSIPTKLLFVLHNKLNQIVLYKFVKVGT
jgi:hypothetical protein